MKINLIVFIVAFVFITACEKKQKVLTPAMEGQARKTIEVYLQQKQLPIEGLNSLSTTSAKIDFSYLYTGEGRCIKFIVRCHTHHCSDWEKYPYDEHGDECP